MPRALAIYSNTWGIGRKFALSGEAPAKRQSPGVKKNSHVDIIGVLKAAQAVCDCRYVSWGSGLRGSPPLMGGANVYPPARELCCKDHKKKGGGQAY